jgi:hydrogenase small subunit
MRINRRDFLKWSAAAVAAMKLEMDIDKFNTVMAAETDPPIIWLLGAGCSGCTMSTLNVTNPTTIDNVLLNKVSMKYDATITTAAGNSAMSVLDNAANQYNGQFILVVEGAVPTGTAENYCILGEQNGVPLTMNAALNKYAPLAKYVVAVGTCASFGGVSAAAPNATSCSTVKTVLSGKTKNPVVNLPGCPTHPTVLVQTLLDLILVGLPTLDSYNRSTKYFTGTVHGKCPRQEANEANQPGVYGCYESIGCMGPITTNNVCPSSSWNNGRGWCIGVDHPCIGCAHPSFPTNPLLSHRD